MQTACPPQAAVALVVQLDALLLLEASGPDMLWLILQHASLCSPSPKWISVLSCQMRQTCIALCYETVCKSTSQVGFIARQFGI